MFSTKLLSLSAAAVFAAAPIFGSQSNPSPPPATAAPTAKASEKTRATSEASAEGATVILPKFEVTGTRLREIDVAIKRLEKQIAREKKALEKSAIDDTLNSDKVSKAAAIFGGKSTSQRASVAAVRLESMQKELELLDTLRQPLTAEDRALIEQLVREQRTYRRDLDVALR